MVEGLVSSAPALLFAFRLCRPSSACLQLARLDKQIGIATAAQASAKSCCEREASCMAAIRGCMAERRETILRELNSHAVAPPATMHVLTAVLRLLGKPSGTFSTWNRAADYFNAGLFEDLNSYNAEQPRDAAVWRSVRAAYKAVDLAKAAEQWTYEMPESAFGAFLKLYIKQVWSLRLSGRLQPGLRSQRKHSIQSLCACAERFCLCVAQEPASSVYAINCPICSLAFCSFAVP